MTPRHDIFRLPSWAHVEKASISRWVVVDLHQMAIPSRKWWSDVIRNAYQGTPICIKRKSFWSPLKFSEINTAVLDSVEAALLNRTESLAISWFFLPWSYYRILSKPFPSICQGSTVCLCIHCEPNHSAYCTHLFTSHLGIRPHIASDGCQVRTPHDHDGTAQHGATEPVTALEIDVDGVSSHIYKTSASHSFAASQHHGTRTTKSSSLF
jgi:hypothetical protein